MIGIITGDIINSRESDPKQWLQSLKKELNKYGKTPKQWEVYRGDSFQLEISPNKALLAALLIKASIKQYKDIDVRIAIGIGKKEYDAKHITESNGSAFIHSGECFEKLKKKTLAIKTNNNQFDETINLMFDLALLTMNNWTPTAALITKTVLEFPNYNQQQLTKILNRTQSNISAGLKRAGYDEIKKLLNYYQNALETL